MKLRTVIVLWIIAAVLGVTSYFVKFHGTKEEIKTTKLAAGDKLFESLPIRDMYAITIAQGDQVTHLTRGKDNHWGIKERENYPVNYKLLSDLLGSFDTLNVAQGYAVEPEYLKRFGLEQDSNSGPIGVTMLGKDDNTLKEIFLGKLSGTSQASGRFVRMTGDESGVYIVEQTFPGVTADPKDWLGKDFLKISQMKSITVSAPEDSSFATWQLIRNNAKLPFKLANINDGEYMQLTATNIFRNLFANSEIQDVLNEAEAQEKANADTKLRRQTIIRTFDSLTYNFQFWPHKPEPVDPNADERLPPSPPSYNITVQVSLDPPKERTKSTSETPEQAEQLNQQFIESKKAAEKKLSEAKRFEGKIYQIGHSHISPLLKTRSDFVKP